MKFDIEHTDTFAGEANYCWVNRHVVEMPELTHYGYDGSTNYSKANAVFRRELVKAAKAKTGLTGIRCRVEWLGNDCTIWPRGMAQVVFVSWKE